MLERKISEYLKEWKQKEKKKALLVIGARHTGKTYSIRRFGKEQYTNLVEINLLENKAARDIFMDVSDIGELIAKLTAYIGNSLKSGKTLIFLDEIQACPKARNAVKLFVDDGRFDCIEAGQPESSFYYEEVYEMYPLDLEEFLWANGIRGAAIEYVKECYDFNMKVSGSVHEMLRRLFKAYVAVGGMPEAVQLFADTHDMAQVKEKQKSILELFIKDIENAEGNGTNRDRVKMKKIMEFIPEQLNKANKRFMLADIRKSARMERYEQCFDRLADTGMTLPCYNVSEPKSPLKNTQKNNLFKLYLADSGLLCTMLPENVQFEVLQNNIEINNGSILENALAQILTANGFVLRYYNEKNKGELDFLLQKDKEAIPVEVRTGDSYKEHSALDYVLSKKEWNLKEGIVFCDRNVEKNGAIRYLPWYMSMFLRA
ncbi:MAG: DUF4143 domain-containing protein [Lachnospiraceae bacterium]|nr:DUF4143 domain-containing protein [Lachnospiraceae bacterium]